MWKNFLLFLFLKNYSVPVEQNQVCVKVFPKHFKLGVATSASQNEGAWNIDGKSESIIDKYSHDFIKSFNGDESCDSYHKYKDDIRLLNFLGVSQYKFSIAWPRILPHGTNDYVNPKGINYYKNLLFELKNNNIEPIVVMYHFDLPQVLQEVGGILNDSFIDWFGNYSRLLFENFGNDVKLWVTLNEPYVICHYGYGYDSTYKVAPAINASSIVQYKCGHNIIKAHAKAWHIYDKEFRPTQNGKIAMPFNAGWYFPATNTPHNIAVAKMALDFHLGWFADPLYYGDYPKEMKNRIGYRSYLEGYQHSRLPKFTKEEKKYIRGTNDFFAIQVYESFVVTDLHEAQFDTPPSLVKDIGGHFSPVKEMGAETLGYLFKWINTRYNNPTIMVTENGYSTRSNILEDDERILFIKRYLVSILRAIEDGSKITAYTLWTLTDNFNLVLDYSYSFGVFQVNFTNPDKPRRARKSAYFYRQLIQTHSIEVPCH